MKYTTIFKRGEQVFFIEDNKIQSAFVYSIVIHDTDTGIFAMYYLTQNKNGTIVVVDKPYTEPHLFSSKELLRQSL